MFVGRRAEKFNAVNNDHGRTLKCDFSDFDRKLPFWANFVKYKIHTCHFKLTLGTYINSNMQNSIVVFNFSVLKWKHLFWANLVQKIKLVNLNQNLVPILIRICGIQWWCLLFCLRPETLLLCKFGQKK